MRRNNYSKIARSMLLATLSTFSVAAHAAEDQPFKDLLFSGFFDIYYQHSFNNPQTGTELAGRQFDVVNDQLSLASLFLAISKPTSAESPFGFTINLGTGRTLDIMNATEPGGTERYKLLQQAYVTYAAPSGYTVDLGKFNTWIGYESATPAFNDLYSISFSYYFAQPIYHTGLRVSKTFGKVSTAAFLVNGWNEVEDSNKQKSYGASGTVSFGKTTVTAGYYGGVEGSPSNSTASGVSGYPVAAGTQVGINLADLIISHQFSDKLKLVVDGDYIDVKGLAGATGGKVSALDATLKYQLSGNLAVALRAESVDSFGSRYSSLTGGLDYSASKSSSFRFELRSDKANFDAFESDNGSKSSRTTLTFAHILKF